MFRYNYVDVWQNTINFFTYHPLNQSKLWAIQGEIQHRRCSGHDLQVSAHKFCSKNINNQLGQETYNVKLSQYYSITEKKNQ